MREVYDLLLKTLRIYRDDTVHLPAWAVKAMYKPFDSVRRMVRGQPSGWVKSNSCACISTLLPA